MLERLAIDDGISQDNITFLESHYEIDQNAQWRLGISDDAMCLSNAELSLSLALDFTEGNYRHRNVHQAKEPLAKAIKIKQKLPLSVIDATPGVLKDSIMLAYRGVLIVAIERNPILFVMVQHALAHLCESNSDINIEYVFGDAKELMHNYRAEALYLDPMYPSKKKNAQVKKDMQVLHHIVGADEDSGVLMHEALKHDARVVVKRPSYAEPLADIKPSFVSQTGATRFDIYLP